jgi:hypothetical protein
VAKSVSEVQILLDGAASQEPGATYYLMPSFFWASSLKPSEHSVHECSLSLSLSLSLSTHTHTHTHTHYNLGPVLESHSSFLAASELLRKAARGPLRPSDKCDL